MTVRWQGKLSNCERKNGDSSREFKFGGSESAIVRPTVSTSISFLRRTYMASTDGNLHEELYLWLRSSGARRLKFYSMRRAFDTLLITVRFGYSCLDFVVQIVLSTDSE